MGLAFFVLPRLRSGRSDPDNEARLPGEAGARRARGTFSTFHQAALPVRGHSS